MIIDVFYGKSKKSLSINDETVSIGGGADDSVYIDLPNLPKSLFTVSTSTDGTVFVKAKKKVLLNGKKVKKSRVNIGDSIIFLVKKTEVIRLTARKEYPIKTISLPRGMIIGKKDFCQLIINIDIVSRLHATVTYRDSVAEISDMNSLNGTYVNGKRIKNCVLKDNDIITIADCNFLYRAGSLSYEDIPLIDYVGDYMQIHSSNYPVIYPSPKLQQPAEDMKLDILPPPNIGTRPEANWFSLIVQPLITGGIMAAIFWVIPKISNINYSPFMMLFSLPMMLISAVGGIINHKKQVKKYKIKFEKKIEKYSNYIKETDNKLSSLYDNQLRLACALNPHVAECFEIVSGEKKDLWNRTVTDGDFLSFRIGTGNVNNAVQIKIPNNEMDIEEDKLFSKIKTVTEKYKVIENMPLTADFKRHPVIGIYGKTGTDLVLIQNFIMQLATFHTYNDLRIVLLTTRPKYESMSWIRWLPHIFSYDRSYRYIALSAEEAKVVLKNAQNELVARKVTRSNALTGKIEIKTPFFVYVITEAEYLNHSELQPFFPDFGIENGVGTLIAADFFDQLPGFTNAFIQISGNDFFFYERANAKTKTCFLPDSYSAEKADSFGRAIAPLRIADANTSGLFPSSVSFFDGMGINTPQEWPLQQHWLEACPEKSMSVPIGISENGDVYYFDINEKKDGPHGIVAGRSGSGKSELLQDWLLSTAMHFSPSDISFILIDPKKAITQLFKTLPHVAGIIEEVENKHLINKCFNALKAEISRRQGLFKSVGVQSVFKYIERRKTDPSLEKISILFFVIDEYAEFKQLYPEIAKDNIDTILRIGRSLGIYAILATQNPSGIITDSMEANIKFRWCLPVAEESYSTVMLGSGHTEAAFLKSPGRAYIKIGSDEFHLVQSFFTGARFEPNSKVKKAVKVPISIVKPDGTRERRFESNTTIALRSYQTEAEIMVDYLNNYVRLNHLLSARQVWTPVMPVTMYLPDLLSLSFDGYDWPESDSFLSVPVGMVDNPFLQSQYPLKLELSGNGPHFIYGSPMSGKTTFLQTVIMSLCLLYSPKDINIYCLDFGSWTLNVFRDYPHVGGIANSNEEEKIRKLVILIREVLKERRSIFSSAGVSNLKIYREVTQEDLPYVVLLVDNLQKVLAYDGDLTEFFQTVASEGANYGVILISTLTGTAGVNFKISDQVKIKIPLQMNDENEYASILGLKSFSVRPMNTPGRGLVEINKYPMEYQTALPVKSNSESEKIIEIKRVGEVMRKAWHGESPRPIPIMPDLIRFGSVRSSGITLGLRTSDIKPVVFNPAFSHFMLISGTPGSGKTNMLGVIGRQFKEMFSAKVIGMDVRGDNNPAVYDEYLSSASKIDSFFENLSIELKRRKDAGSDSDLRSDCIVILVDNFRIFFEQISDNSAKRLEALIKLGKGLNVFCIIADDSDSFAKEYGRTEPFTTIGNGRYRVLLGGTFNLHAQFDSDLLFSEKSELLNDYEGYFLDGKTTVKFKCMKGD